MLTGKQRAALRRMANPMDTIIQIGKGGIEAESIRTVDNALEARELIKLSVLENSSEDVREAAEALADATGAEVAGVIGKKIILYRESKNKKIEL